MSHQEPAGSKGQFDAAPILDVLERHRVQYVVIGGYGGPALSATTDRGHRRHAGDHPRQPGRLAEALGELGAKDLRALPELYELAAAQDGVDPRTP